MSLAIIINNGIYNVKTTKKRKVKKGRKVALKQVTATDKRCR